MYDALPFSLVQPPAQQQFSIDLCKLQNRKTKCKFVKHSAATKQNKYIIYSIVNKWMLACVIHVINKCENKLFACFVCQFPSATHTHTHTHPYPYPYRRGIVMSNNCRSARTGIPFPLQLCPFRWTLPVRG